MDMTPQTWPDWYDGKHINEVLFLPAVFGEAPHEMCARAAVHRGWPH